MSIAELVPSWRALPDAVGPLIDGASLRGRSYRMRSADKVDLTAHGILKARGQADHHSEFLAPRLDRDMPSPWLLTDMDAAAERIAMAVERREKVIVFGDYDVDGASSTAVLGRWFAGVGLAIDAYIPDRLTEGYGPSPIAIERATAGKPDLLICVDCGTAAKEILDQVSSDVIVIDHHKQQGDLPDIVAVVNPHREDDTSGLGMLCAAGLSFLTVVAANSVLRERGTLPDNAPKVKDLLDIVALATVADVVPLIGPSRLFVAKGLEIIAKSPSPGISALMAIAGVKDVSAGKIGFALGPRVNAGGRVGNGSSEMDGALGVKLLMAAAREEADRHAAQLDSMNRQRQEVQQSCLEEAISLAQKQIDEGAPMITVFGQGWHPGVVGIVAGRLRERFDVPVLVGAFDGALIKGSGRSVPGFDLGAVIIEASKRGLLEKGGGHAMACGFTCRDKEWSDFERFVRGRARWAPEPVIVDCLIEGADIEMDAVQTLVQLEPLGQGNPSVKAVIGSLEVGAVRQLKGGHVKVDLHHSNGIVEGLWWRAAEDGFEEILLGMKGVKVQAVGAPRVDEWQGRRRISMELVDLIPAA